MLEKLKSFFASRTRRIVYIVAGICILAVLVVSVCMGSGKAKGPSGEYNLSGFTYQGMSLLDINRGSYFDISGQGDGASATLCFRLDFDDGIMTDYTFGYMEEISRDGEYRRYKFWISNHIGDFFSDSNSMFYCDYYSDDDRIVIRSEDTKYTFSK